MYALLTLNDAAGWTSGAVGYGGNSVFEVLLFIVVLGTGKVYIVSLGICVNGYEYCTLDESVWF